MKGILVSTTSPVILLAILALVSRAAFTINAPPTVIDDRATYNEFYILNISSGGVVGGDVTANGSEVNISGGTIGAGFLSLTTTRTTITGGTFGSDFRGFGSSPGFTKISGGVFGSNFELAGNGTEFIGNDFRLNGTPVSGVTRMSSASDVFTGTLKDGTVFVLSPLVDDRFQGTVKLTSATLPAPPASPFTVSANNGPRGLRAGKTLNLVTGGTLIDNFAAVDATLNISGGNAGEGLEVVGSQVTITGGVVGNGFHVFAGSTVNISGGAIRGGAEAFAGSIVNVTGGELGGYVTANSGSQWNITGGVFETDFIASSGSNVRITGGKFRFVEANDGSSAIISGGQFQPYFRGSGSKVSIEGGEFLLNGAPYAGSIVSLAPTDVLTGVLTDGNEFIFTPMENDALTGVSLVQRSIPVAGPSIITVSSTNAPLALRVGQTVNLVAGGVLPDLFPIASGTLNVTGGTTGRGLKADRSQINVASGNIGGIALFHSNMSIQGGTVGTFAADYSHVDILPGATVNGIGISAGSSVNMTGGTMSDSGYAAVYDGGVFTMTGGELKGKLYVYANGAAHLSNATAKYVKAEQYSSLDANDVTIYSLNTINNTTIELTSTIVTNGASLSGKVNFYSGSLPNHTSATSLGVINIRGGTVGSSFTADFESVVNIMGGTVGAGFTAGLQSKVTISGGTVGSGFKTNSISTVTISGGSVGAMFSANSLSTVNITAGNVGDKFAANSGSTVNLSGGAVGAMLNVAGGTFKITGGSIGDDAIVQCPVSTARAKLTINSGAIGNHFRVQGYFSQPNPDVAPVIGPATVEISGGTIGVGFSAGISSIVNISGGNFGDLFVAEKGSTINLFGTSFFVNGDPIPGLIRDMPYTITNRDVTLSGLFIDGAPFSFDLNSTGTTSDRFDSLATLTVTLKAPAVPEPAAGAPFLVALCTFAGVGRNRRICRMS